ncbi:hypothetical protein [Novosphingobium sp.]|uniref:hypothetical protein n=1 Tax=Novosphingobium sp. TaxID=1874826 RepID=UPI0031D609B1
MVDRVSAFITIGGKLSSQHLPEFLDLIAQEDLSLEWDGEPFEVSQFVPGHPLCLMSHEVALGQFTQLEDFCFARSLPFRRWCDGCSSWMPQRAVFDGSGDVVYIDTDGGDRALLGRNTVTELETFESIVAWFDAADFTVPSLEIVPQPERNGHS